MTCKYITWVPRKKNRRISRNNPQLLKGVGKQVGEEGDMLLLCISKKYCILSRLMCCYGGHFLERANRDYRGTGGNLIIIRYYYYYYYYYSLCSSTNILGTLVDFLEHI